VYPNDIAIVGVVAFLARDKIHRTLRVKRNIDSGCKLLAGDDYWTKSNRKREGIIADESEQIKSDCNYSDIINTLLAN
jgi:hypothetical protein